MIMRSSGCLPWLGVLVLTTTLAAQGYQINQWLGTASGETLGWSAAIVGDVNNDGAADVVIGAPGATVNGQPNAGRAQVFSGATGALLHTFNGTACCQYFGQAVAAAGDVDADGTPDLMVGAPAASPGGYVKVFSGQTWATIWTLPGQQLQDEFGYSVAGAGDLDGDGHADLVVGARYVDSPATNTGQVKVFSGIDASVLHTFNGAAAWDTFGDSVASAGDFDNDGVGDIIAGATQPGFMGTVPNGPGYAKVFSGANGALLATLLPNLPASNFGAAVSGAGDVDQDGFDDVMVGNPDVQGWAFFFSGGTLGIIRTLTGSPPNDHLGMSLAQAGDVDADGYPDQIIGSPGAGSGVARIHSGLTGGVLATLTGPTLGAGANFGYSVSGGKDVDADGAPDVLVTFPFAASGASFAAGGARAFSLLGLPSGYVSAFGAGCASATTGFTPKISTAGGAPAATGNPAFAIHLTRALPGSAAALIVGASSSSWMGIPLPLLLGPLGIPGCTLFVAGDLLLPFPVGSDGRAAFPAPVPASPSLAGFVGYVQWYVVDPGPAAVPGTLSGALQISVF